jgi:ribonuclease G
MSKELVIGSNRHETKVAVLEDDQLVELYFQRANEYSLAGSVHKGRVTRVLPGMQSAFVDLGLERDTFLYVSDFFDELNPDEIDTVSDEKPPLRSASGRDAEGNPERSRDDRDRGRDDRNRRDRGGRSSHSERSAGERSSGERPAVTPEPERFIAAPPALLSDSEMGEDEDEVLEASAAPVTLAGEVRAGAADSQVRPPSHQPSHQPSGDRNRGGSNEDRGRNRRSRRRRGRGGRGIPENKYAQPNETTSVPVLHANRAEPVESEPELVDETIAPAADVIILPGESLAKYRTRPVTPQVEAQQEEESEDEAFDEEAESLELADKVFSHRASDGPVLEEEIKLAEVRHDHPAPEPLLASSLPEEQPRPFIAASLAAESEAESEFEIVSAEGHAVPEARQERLADISWSPERRAAEELFSKVVPIREDEAEAEARAHLGLSPHTEQSQTEAFEAEVDELDSTGSLASVHDLAPEIEEALESGDFESGQPEETSGTAEQTTQTASLREQGGRLPHRSSRRMRRRRGGNRSGNEAASNTPVNAGTGVAPALQPEVREVREPRETREPRESRSEPVEERVTERPERSERVMPSISDLLKAGQEIIVQIAKEPLGQKGARITSHIALPGRYVVFMPSVNHLGVSRKVSSDEERHRLKRILQAHRVGTTGGFIVRTAGEGVPEEEIAADMNFLYTLWLDIRQKAEKKPAPVLLHYDLDVVQRILRDQITEDFKAIWVDNEDLYESVLTFMQRFQPALVNRVKMYTRSAPIFDAFNITQELEKALRPKVWLKSGGYLVINQTEALVAIDINTGKYVGRSNRLEDTIVKTNTEAVKEIVRQIRLRDLGGIIVVDFIDMDERKNRQKVMQALEEAMRSDKAPYKILQFNDFGLVAITRKRVKQSLERTLCAPCHYCEGAGYVKSTQTVIGEILIEAQKLSKAIEGKDVLLRVHPEVAKVLKSSDNKYLDELEEILGRPVLVKGDATLHIEKFDLG